MRFSFRSRWLWMGLLIVLMLLGGIFYLKLSVSNVMHPALDKLSAVPFSERWSHPEMLRIRELGQKAVPSLRRVLRERDSMATRVSLWTKANLPELAKRFANLPDPQRINERCWAACQALRTLGPAGRPAAPEILGLLDSKDLKYSNAATMALYAIGIDAEICERLAGLLEKGVSDVARTQIVGALGSVKPPSARTLKALLTALTDSSPYIQDRAAESLGRLEVRTPEIIAALKNLQSSSNETVLLSASAALWEIEKDPALVLVTVLVALERELLSFSAFPNGGDSGQGVSMSEQLFMKGAYLFQKMALREPERSKTLSLLEKCCEKSGRIFIRMLLLPAMLELGYPDEKCVAVCRAGLNRKEDYYRLQAARLLVDVGSKHPVEEMNLDDLIHHRDVGVRVYGAKLHWLKRRQASDVVPVLIEALDYSKHQSYYYAEVQPVALTVLGDIGRDASAATGPLQKLLKDPNPNIVKLASESLAKIQASPK